MVDYKYADLFMMDSVEKSLSIKFDTGEIKNVDLEAENFELSESLCSESELKFGSCEASSVKFRVHNIFESLVGKELTISMALDGNDDEPFQIGVYKVYSDTPTADRKFRDIVAYDWMYDIINAEMSDWYNTVLPNADSTVTMKEFRDSLFDYIGIEQEDVNLINDDMIVERTITPSQLSGKNVIAAICELNGTLGHINRFGRFEHISLVQDIQQGLYPSDTLYPEDTLYPIEPKSTEISKSNYISCKYDDYLCKSITQVQIRQSENDIGAVAGESGNCYIVQDNFLVYGKGAEELLKIAENLLGTITGLVYRPFECEARGNLCIPVGEPVRLSTAYEIIETYVLQRTLKGIQALRDTYVSTGVEEYAENVNSTSNEIIQLKGKTNELTRTVEETRAIIADVEEKVETEISQTARSVTITAKNNADDTSTGIKIQLLDKNGEEIDSDSANIELTGLVSFSDLSQSGKTVINGSNITTGTIDADIVNVVNVVAKSVAAEDITGTTISGKTVICNSGEFGGWKVNGNSLYSGDTDSSFLQLNSAGSSLVSIKGTYKTVLSAGQLFFYNNDNRIGIITNGTDNDTGEDTLNVVLSGENNLFSVSYLTEENDGNVKYDYYFKVTNSGSEFAKDIIYHSKTRYYFNSAQNGYISAINIDSRPFLGIFSPYGTAITMGYYKDNEDTVYRLFWMNENGAEFDTKLFVKELRDNTGNYYFSTLYFDDVPYGWKCSSNLLTGGNLWVGGSKKYYTDSSGNKIDYNFSVIGKSYFSEEIKIGAYEVIKKVNWSDGSNNEILIGWNNSKLWASIDGTWYVITTSTSDVRLKENFKNAEVNALNVINKMQLREFDWKESGKHQSIGFIADELEELDENFVIGGGYMDEEETQPIIKTIDTLYLCSYLAKAIQEQQKQIETLKQSIESLRKGE